LPGSGRAPFGPAVQRLLAGSQIATGAAGSTPSLLHGCWQVARIPILSQVLSAVQTSDTVDLQVGQFSYRPVLARPHDSTDIYPLYAHSRLINMHWRVFIALKSRTN